MPAYAEAMATGSTLSRMGPLDGDRRLISAMTAQGLLARAPLKSRAGAWLPPPLTRSSIGRFALASSTSRVLR